MRVAVIGAGIVGVSCAEWLRRAGAAATVFDPAGPAGETSAGNAGLVIARAAGPVQEPGVAWEAAKMLIAGGAFRLDWRRTPSLAPWLWALWRRSDAETVRTNAARLSALVDDAPEQHRALAAGTDAARYLRPATWRRLFRTAAPIDGFGFQLRRALGAEIAPVDPADLRAQDPHVNPAYRSAWDVRGLARITDPPAYVRALAAAFAAAGGVLDRRAVAAVRPTEGGAALQVGGETLSFDHVVVAAGAWTPRLAAAFGVKIPIVAERGYHAEFWSPSVAPPEDLVYGLEDSHHVIHGMAGRLRVTSISEPAAIDSPPNPRAQAYATAGGRRLYPTLVAKGVTHWMGRRPSTPDGLPMIGAVPSAPRVWLAAGHQHYGLSLGPRTGRLIADLIFERRPNLDLTPFRVDRFT